MHTNQLKRFSPESWGYQAPNWRARGADPTCLRHSEKNHKQECRYQKKTIWGLSLVNLSSLQTKYLGFPQTRYLVPRPRGQNVLYLLHRCKDKLEVPIIIEQGLCAVELSPRGVHCVLRGLFDSVRSIWADPTFLRLLCHCGGHNTLYKTRLIL